MKLLLLTLFWLTVCCMVLGLGLIAWELITEWLTGLAQKRRRIAYREPQPEKLDHELGLMAYRLIVDMNENVDASQRRVLVNFVLAVAGVGPDRNFMINVTNSVDGSYCQYFLADLAPLLSRYGCLMGVQVPYTQYDQLVTDLTADEPFFWYCITYAHLIECFRELSFTCGSPYGNFEIPQEIIPSSLTIRRLNALYRHFIVPEGIVLER